MYKRLLSEQIAKQFHLGNVIILVGPRQVGKTTLIESLLKKTIVDSDIVHFNGDYLEDRELLSQESIHKLSLIIGNRATIFIDEGQRIDNIGTILKILTDHYKDKKQIIVTGSSSLHLLDKTEEPLTGRKIVFRMFPVSSEEFALSRTPKNLISSLEDFLIYGLYPKVLNQTSYADKVRELVELTTSNLYKDILEFQSIRNPSHLSKLLKAIALQIGSEVSLNEIAGMIGLNVRTVERYIDLLEKSYIIFRLPPYFTNKRKELTKMNKIFFYDLGIRNAIIHNFNRLSDRNDVGGLFENFMVVERLKYRSYHDIYADQYFWKEYNGKEIDLIEEHSGKIHAYEFKWTKSPTKAPIAFAHAYPDHAYIGVNRNNFTDIVL